jgi:hypothetical protein
MNITKKLKLSLKSIDQKISAMKFSSIFIWIFLFGNFFLGFVGAILTRGVSLLYRTLEQAHYVAFTISYLMFFIKLSYAIFSLVLIYKKRRESTVRIDFFIYGYIVLSALCFLIIGNFSPIQFLGRMLYGALTGVDVLSFFAFLNPRYY